MSSNYLKTKTYKFKRVKKKFSEFLFNLCFQFFTKFCTNSVDCVLRQGDMQDHCDFYFLRKSLCFDVHMTAQENALFFARLLRTYGFIARARDKMQKFAVHSLQRMTSWL